MVFHPTAAEKFRNCFDELHRYSGREGARSGDEALEGRGPHGLRPKPESGLGGGFSAGGAGLP